MRGHSGALTAFLTLLFPLLVAGCATSPAPVRMPNIPAPVIMGPPGTPTNPPAGYFQPNANLYLCNDFSISNAPPARADLQIEPFTPVAILNGVVIATVPANDVCLSSGFGPRGGRNHDGIDLTSNPPATIYAAAPGVIREAREARGYGNMVLIDHGRGVYTLYAHLEWLDPGLAPDLEIGFGQPIGKMGRSGNATGIHLHYEILQGQWTRARGSADLVPISPLNLPRWQGLGTS